MARSDRVVVRECAVAIRVEVEGAEGVRVEMLRVRLERAESRVLRWLRISDSMLVVAGGMRGVMGCNWWKRR